MSTFFTIDINKTHENCPICLENININNNSITLECQHRYCKTCIDNLFSSKLNNKCPLCRSSIELNKCIINENNSTNNDYISKKFNTINKYNSNFIHFKTKNLCDKFLRKARRKLTIEHVCCSGTGCKINNLTTQQIMKLKKNFLENNTINYN
jgi:hypothetical protein|tara:strand:- start:882 stop:1340 length:459 start_codon:yes stop_codon:yes gene_type:complete